MADQNDYVRLPDLVTEVRKRRAAETEAAQNIIAEAHQLGDLDLKIRRPDGTFEDLRRDIWQPDSAWRQLFDSGIIKAERAPRGMRRVGSMELCRIYGIRQNLDDFLGVAPAPATPAKASGGRPTDKDLIINEAKERIRLRKRAPLPATLREFAVQLREWLKNQPGAKRPRKTGEVMAIETIEGHIRPLWQQLSK